MTPKRAWLAIAAGAFAILAVIIVARSGEPSLAQGLPRSWDGAEREFDRRVKARFPVGSVAAELRQVLSRQGFVPSNGFAPEQAWRLDRSDLVCRVGAYVLWRADAAGRLVSVSGRYREEGCL